MVLDSNIPNSSRNLSGFDPGSSTHGALLYLVVSIEFSPLSTVELTIILFVDMDGVI